MTRIYGGCVEPEGIDLEDSYETRPCPGCGSPSLHWWLERAKGSLNTYTGCAATRAAWNAATNPTSEAEAWELTRPSPLRWHSIGQRRRDPGQLRPPGLQAARGTPRFKAAFRGGG